MRNLMIAALVLGVSASLFAGEEKIRGVLEKTTKPGACAQITDALSEIYYVTKSDEAEKMIATFVGKNEKVVITGTVEQKEGDPAYYFTLKSVEAYATKLPPVPAAPGTPVVAPAPAPAPAPVDPGVAVPPVAPAPPAPAPAPAPEKKDEKTAPADQKK